jgi:hypothetical protein
VAEPESLVPRPAGALDADRRRALQLAPKEGFVLSLVDGATNVRDMAETTGMQVEEVVASLLKLEALSLVVMPDGRPADAPSEAKIEAKGARRSKRPPGARQSRAPSRPSSSGKAAPPAASVAEAVDLEPQQQQEIATIFARLDQTDHYALLGVERSADKKAIKRAYFELTSRFHPDRFFRKKLGPFKAQMEAIFGRMSVAHETLTSDNRAEYDAYLGSVDRTRRIEEMVEEATAEIRRVEETARGMAAAPPPSAPAVETPVAGKPPTAPVVTDEVARAKGAPPAEASRPRANVTSAQREAEAKTRREMLARRLTGNGARPPPPAAPAVSPATYAKPADAVDALKRRYEARLLAAKTSQAKKYAESGIAARAKGDVVAAANALRVAVTFDENNAELKAAYEDAQRASDQLLAEQYSKQADYEEKAERWPDAARSWQRVARARENDAKAHERAAHCLVKASGNLHEASKLAQRAVQLNPKSAQAHVVLANVYLAAGLGKNGKRELESALALAPNDAGIVTLLKRIGKGE